MGFRPLLTQRFYFLRLAQRTVLWTTLVGLHTVLIPFSGDRAIAQIIPDGTLTNRSTVSDNGATTTITGGTRNGNFLFHSFEEFSVLEEQTASFDNDAVIESIFTRVTGGAVSSIDGIIAAQGNADFFLINPNGIVFGPNAQLNVGGSFIASSADQFVFDDGSVFSATNPQAPPLLTVNTAIGLQYGTTPGSITVQGNGNGLFLDPDTLEVVSTNRPDGLHVNAEETLALIGGDVVLDGGNLTAIAGRVILGGAADGTVTLREEGTGWDAQYDTDALNHLVTLQNAASALTSGSGGGSIQLSGRAIDIRNGSSLLANTIGANDAGGVDLQATERIRLTGAVLDDQGEALFPTSILVEVLTDGTGTGGDITIDTPRLRVARGAQLSTSTLGSGDGGDIEVTAHRINVIGGAGTETPSGLFANVLDPNATGNGGTLTIQAKRLNVLGGAEISATTLGIGQGGTIRLDIDEINVIAGAPGLGSSGIFAQTDFGATGNGGNIFIEGDRLYLSGGAALGIATFESGSSGVLDIVVNSMILEGQSPNGIRTTVSATADIPQDVDLTGEESFTGNGGDISITTNQLSILNGAQLISSTFNDGNAGSIQINARDVVLESDDDLRTSLSSAVEFGSTGQGGLITLITDTLTIANGAQIVSGTLSDGRAGDVSIQSRSIEVDGRNNLARSGILASAIVGNGAGGNLDLQTETLTVRDGGLISASNFFTGTSDIPSGQGPAGNIDITADRIRLDGGDITASTAVGDQGNIALRSKLLVLNNRSRISTDAAGANGGNIVIDTDSVVALGDSDITANAAVGRGGQVSITANGLFGIQFRERLTDLNDITVTSNLGPQFNGVVELNTPDVDPLQGVVELSRDLLDPNTEVLAACEEFRGNELIVTGRGGLPINAHHLIHGTTTWPDLRLGEQATEQRSSELNYDRMEVQQQTASAVLPSSEHSRAMMAHPPVTEAEHWKVSDTGDVQLVASSSFNRSVRGDRSPSCY